MDDVRTVQLANVLRSISCQAHRQLVVAVHERSLFEYLCLELGPTRSGDSLLAVELIPNDNVFGTKIQFERREWKADILRFGNDG